jgi:serine protease Do
MKYFGDRNSKFFLVIATFSIIAIITGCTTSPASTQTTTSGSTSTQATPSGSTSSTTAVTDSAPTNFITAVQQVLPSVVKIEVTYGPQGAPGDPQAQGASGTGWVIRTDGMIVTNNHVIDSAQTVTVILPDGTKYPATAIKTDAIKDLAVIKIAAQNLPVAITGDSSQLMLGQPVAAIGNALDLGIRVTVGVVSLLNVTITVSNQTLSGLIETDAAINPGNSGGVLINTLGQVIGIPNAGLDDPSLDIENFGYAISINEAIPVITNLMAQIP